MASVHRWCYVSAGMVQRVTQAAIWHLYTKHLIAWRSLRQSLKSKYQHFPIVSGIGAEIQPRRGRALLDFIVDPFLPGFSEEYGRTHANYFKTRAIVEILNAAGFSVDVTDWRSMHAPSADGYDIVIGQGHAFEQSCRKSRNRIPRIYLGWGLHADATRLAITKRATELHRRRGVTIPLSHSRDDGPKYCTDIFYLGNDHTRRSYLQRSNAELHCLRNPITSGVTSTLSEKDFAASRTRFLWMAAYGTLRRSLDVLLEVFEKAPHLELWICGDVAHEKIFFHSYRRELLDLPNVKYIGWVDVAGDSYRNVTRKCGYILYPSVSDGMPGSVVNAMASGLVPIVTEDAGMECGGYDLPISEVSHKAIREIIQTAAAVSPKALEKQSHEVVRFATTYYSQEAFRSHFSAALTRVLERQEKLEPTQALASR
jgi:glycosyltransferase involved in cell wall biosynthesis